MSSIVTSILSSTVGLFWNKARNSTAGKLKDGDITDAKIREIVVREMDDIKTKLDGLSRRDLLSSYCFLKEGVDFLKVCLDESKFEQKLAATLATADDRGEASRMSSNVQSEILNEALQLPHAIGKMKIYSDKEFESANERFKDARKKATEAFCNEALSIQDRIFVAKVRVVSEILECLENPQTAITGCLSFLKDLHGLPAVREIFSVYLNGGVKSLLNKAERAENVKSIMMINYVVFDLILKFSRNVTDRLTWPGPRIKLADRSFNPITGWQEISTRKSMGKDLQSQPLDKLIFDKATLPYLCAVNSRGDVVVVNNDGTTINVVSKAGESKVVKLPNFRELRAFFSETCERPEAGESRRYTIRVLGESTLVNKGIAGVAVDNNNNIYVVSWFKTLTYTELLGFTDEIRYMLNVLVQDDSFVKQVCKLDFLGEDWYLNVLRMTINGNNNIIIVSSTDPCVYICDVTGMLKHKFEFSHCPSMLSISHKNEIMISSEGLGTLHFYSEEGDLKSTIYLPDGHVACGAAFHYVLCKIIVLTNVAEKDSCFLLCYSETGELETSTFFGEKNEKKFPTITSHPGGPVVVARSKSITFI